MQAPLDRINQLTDVIIGAAIEVHQHLGPRLLEHVYARALAHELELRGVPCERETALQAAYKGLTIDRAYRLDLLVDGLVIVEVKAVKALQDVHKAQLRTYLKLAKRNVGLLLNFNVLRLTQGIVRVIEG